MIKEFHWEQKAPPNVFEYIDCLESSKNKMHFSCHFPNVLQVTDPIYVAKNESCLIKTYVENIVIFFFWKIG